MRSAEHSDRPLGPQNGAAFHNLLVLRYACHAQTQTSIIFIQINLPAAADTVTSICLACVFAALWETSSYPGCHLSNVTNSKDYQHNLAA